MKNLQILNLKKFHWYLCSFYNLKPFFNTFVENKSSVTILHLKNCFSSSKIIISVMVVFFSFFFFFEILEFWINVSYSTLIFAFSVRIQNVYVHQGFISLFHYFFDNIQILFSMILSMLEKVRFWVFVVKGKMERIVLKSLGFI